MLARGLLVLMSLSAVAAVAAPVPKSLKKVPNKFDSARFNVSDNTPLGRALEHFAEETGLEWVGDRPQLGTLTRIFPKEYTAVEFIDVLNERLRREE